MTGHTDPWIPATQVFERLGISDAAARRRLANPDSLFPDPAYFGARRFWKRSWLDEYDLAVTAVSCAAEATRDQIIVTLRERFPDADDALIERGLKRASRKRPDLAAPVEPVELAEAAA